MELRLQHQADFTLLADDVFRTKLGETTAALEGWAKKMGPFAQVERSETNWRIKLVPPVPNACPCELILRRDQRFDLAIGEETYEDFPVRDLDLFLPLLEAVVAGNVSTKRWVSSATGLEYQVETVVPLPDGTSWRADRRNPLAPDPPEINLECEGRQYVPYFRS
jgi:hypothetical protein